ncbi:MAG TPA: DNA cytosine methyltransferase [Burkholderiales bacterium]|nr:DNA cytosine methyltransferase [Burkholderiales bacterium]
MNDIREIRHFHLFAGLGGGARGFNRGQARVGNMVAKFRCIGGIDVDRAAMADFGKLTGVAGTVLDLFDRSQYIAFHGKEPPADWRAATPQDIQRAAGGERPHIVFLSAPCKGFSGLLSETKSRTDKYQALNRLTVRGVFLMLEAWKDDPPELIVFENVPRIANRGRKLLDQIVALLRSYSYAVAETTHDCGELGGLAQSRKRFLLVARHAEKVPAFLYQPDKRPLRAVGDVLSKLPMPGDPRGGPMHRMPALQWKTWVRLAFVEAGSDWRSLNRLAVQDGALRDYLIVPAAHGGYLGVNGWNETAGVVAGHSRAANGNFSVADPRAELYSHGYGVMGWRETAGAIAGESLPSNGRFAVADPRGQHRHEFGQYGVRQWSDTMGVVSGQTAPGGGPNSIADPRMPPSENRQNGMYRVVAWDRTALAVTGASHVGGAAQSVADPRGGPSADLLHGKYHMTPWNEPARTVIAGNANGAFAVADPRPAIDPAQRDAYLTGGHYGVVPWAATAGAVSASAVHDNGRWSVADPRPMPAPADKLVACIRALDGTWHRPFTTLDLAALQSLVDPEEYLELNGLSDQAWRERIGNAVPPEAAAAIAGVMGTTLLLSWAGESFQLSSQAIWVRPVALALAVRQP